MKNTVVVFSDWAGFPLYRQRMLGQRNMDCGLGHILDNALSFNPGIDFDAVLVINEDDYIPTWKDKLKGVFQKDHIRNNAATYKKAKRAMYESLPGKYPFLRQVYFRNNLGQDFGAYNFAVRQLNKDGFKGEVLLLNSSLEGPFEEGWLKKYYDLFHSKNDVGLCGISLHSHNTNIQNNPPFAPHVGSYLLYTSMPILNKVFPAGISGADTDDKNIIIAEGEVGISREVLNAGYGICCCAAPGFYYKNGGEWTIEAGALPSNRKI